MRMIFFMKLGQFNIETVVTVIVIFIYRLPRTLYSLFWSMFGLIPVDSVQIKYPGK